MAGKIASDFIAQTFSAESYQRLKEKKRLKDVIIHHLISLKQSETEINRWIELGKTKKPERLDFTTSEYKLTPLVVAVLAQNVPATQKLLEAGARPSVADAAGWTPLHHATVLQNEELKNLLIQNMGGEEAAAQVKSNFGGSFKDLENLINRRPAADDQIVCQLFEDGVASDCTAKKFRELTQADFCEGLIAKPNDLMNWWKAKPRGHFFYGLLNKPLKNKYSDYLASPPKISLVKPDSYNEVGYEVRAESQIHKSQMVCLYGGEIKVTDTEYELIDYVLEETNATRARNLGPMINDSFPNCAYLPMQIDGVEASAILALRDIQPGEYLHINYGAQHPCKLTQPHVELNKTALLEYMPNVVSDYRTFKSEQVLQGDMIKNLANQHRLKYLFTTPTSILWLVSQEKFPKDLVENCLQGTKLDDFFNGFDVTPDENIRSFLIFQFQLYALLDKYCDQIAESYPEITLNIRELCEVWSSALSAQSLSYLVSDLVKNLESIKNIEASKRLEAWEDYKKDLEPQVTLLKTVIPYCTKKREDRSRDDLNLIRQSHKELGEAKRDYAKSYLRNCMRLLEPLDTLRLDLQSLVGHD